MEHISASFHSLIEEDIDEFSTISVDLLKRVANIRYILSSTASILYTFSHTNEREEEKSYRKLFALLMKFIAKVRNNELHMFFLREIIRRYGLRELEHIVEKTGYTWLNLDREDPASVSICLCNILFVYF